MGFIMKDFRDLTKKQALNIFFPKKIKHKAFFGKKSLKKELLCILDSNEKFFIQDFSEYLSCDDSLGIPLWVWEIIEVMSKILSPIESFDLTKELINSIKIGCDTDKILEKFIVFLISSLKNSKHEKTSYKYFNIIMYSYKELSPFEIIIYSSLNLSYGFEDKYLHNDYYNNILKCYKKLTEFFNELN